MSDVIIEISSLQEDEEITYLYTEGQLNKSSENVTLEFDGTEVCGVIGQKFSLSINGEDMVKMTSEGQDSSSEFVLEKGVKHYCEFKDDMGDMLVGVDALNIISNFQGESGNLEVKYVLDFNHSVSTTNIVKVSVREKQ